MVKLRKDNDNLEIETESGEQFEDESVETEEEMIADKFKKLKEKLKQAEQDKMSALEDLQRAKADFLNARRRLDEDKLVERDRIKAGLVEEILPLLDSFEMAMQDSAFETAPENLKKGLHGIFLQLSSILKNYGVTSFGQEGDVFDPAVHEALADNGSGSTVKSVVMKGYKMGDKIVRHARVTVE